MTERDWDTLLSGMDAKFEILREDILSADADGDCRTKLIAEAHDLSLRMLAVMAAHQRDREVNSSRSSDWIGDSGKARESDSLQLVGVG